MIHKYICIFLNLNIINLKKIGNNTLKYRVEAFTTLFVSKVVHVINKRVFQFVEKYFPVLYFNWLTKFIKLLL